MSMTSTCSYLIDCLKSSRHREQLWDGTSLGTYHSVNSRLMAAHTPLLTLTLTFPEMALHILSHRGVPVGLRVTPFADCWDHKARFLAGQSPIRTGCAPFATQGTAHRPPIPVAIWNRPAHNARPAFATMLRARSDNVLGLHKWCPPPMANGVPGQTSPRKLGILYLCTTVLGGHCPPQWK